MAGCRTGSFALEVSRTPSALARLESLLSRIQSMTALTFLGWNPVPLPAVWPMELTAKNREFRNCWPTMSTMSPMSMSSRNCRHRKSVASSALVKFSLSAAISLDTAVSPIRSSSSGLASTLLITTANGVRSLPFLSASAVWRRSFCNALITSSRRASLMEARSPESRSSTHSARNRGMASGSIIRTMPSQCSYWLWRSFSRLSTKVSPAMSSSCMSRDGLTPDPSMKKLNEKALLAPCTVVAAVFSTTPSR